jgi:FKBP-type peptidyl-prolyl cis-trans isomerase
MKYLLVVGISLLLLACQGNTQGKVDLKSTTDSVSYSIGMSIGHNLKNQKVDVAVAVLAQGIRDILDSNTTLLTDEQAQSCMIAFNQRMREKMEQEANIAGVKNKKEGEAFLAANKTKDGVHVTPSGLQYKVITMGNGPKPKADQTVTVNYRGTTIDGKEFDSSYKRGQPVTFVLNQVIKGWTEGLQLMPAGSKWQLFIPAELAYGERGAGGEIGPNATLIFDVELLSVK